MSDRIYFRPLIPLLISLMGGILLGSRFAGLATAFGVLAVVGGGYSLVCFYRRTSVLLMPLLLFAAVGYLSIQPWLAPRIPNNHIQNYTGTRRWDISGQIAEQPWQIGNRTRFDMRVVSLDADHQTLAASGLLRVTVVGDRPDIHVGDKIRFKSRMRPISNFKNPGGFDYKRYMAFKGILATAYARGGQLKITEKSSPSGISQTINRVRNRFADLVENSGSPEVQGVLKALIIGDRTQISESIRQHFNRAGVAHLLAISGLHIGIVAAVAFALFNWLSGWVKPLLWRAWTRKSAALLSLAPVVAYGVVAGFSPSTQRAVLMVTVFLMTFLLAKEQDSLNTLALAALVILIVDPPSLFSISFQLSFVTVLTIIYGFRSIQNVAFLQTIREKSSWQMRLAVRLFSFFLVSLFAICGSMPLVAFYFNQVSLVGLIANFLVVPLVGFITVPLGLLSFFILPLSATLAAWCLAAGAVSLAVALDIVNFFADLPFAAVKTITPSPLEIICYYTLGWALLNMLRSPPDCVPQHPAAPASPFNGNVPKLDDAVPVNAPGLKNIFGFGKGDGGPGVHFKKWPQTVMILTLLILGADSCYWLYQRFWHSDLRITIIDVGDGSASLLEIPGGYTIMIDGGGFSDNSNFDVGSRIIAPLLWKKKIKTVDLLVLSHPNSDHLNGLNYLADQFNVTTLWTNDEPRSTLGYRQLMKVCARRGIFLPDYAHMERQHLIGGVQLDILYPPRDFMDQKQSDKWRNTNNNSLVVKASYGEASFLFAGDIMAPAERELLELAGSHIASRVLIAPHHGSRSSSGIEFLRAVDPEVVVVSCGRNGRFNFPHPEILERYEDMGVSIFRTDINGAVRLSTDGQLIRIDSVIPDPDEL